MTSRCALLQWEEAKKTLFVGTGLDGMYRAHVVTSFKDPFDKESPIRSKFNRQRGGWMAWKDLNPGKMRRGQLHHPTVSGF